MNCINGIFCAQIYISIYVKKFIFYTFCVFFILNSNFRFDWAHWRVVHLPILCCVSFDKDFFLFLKILMSEWMEVNENLRNFRRKVQLVQQIPQIFFTLSISIQFIWFFEAFPWSLCNLISEIPQKSSQTN